MSINTLQRKTDHWSYSKHVLFTERTAVQNEVALSYGRVRGLYFRAVLFAATIVGV